MKKLIVLLHLIFLLPISAQESKLLWNVWDRYGSFGDPKEGCFTPDSKHLVATSGELIWVFDVLTGDSLRTMNNFDMGIGNLALSPDGKTIVTSGNSTGPGKGEVRFWNFETGAFIRQFTEFEEITNTPGHGVGDLEYSKDGSYLFVLTRTVDGKHTFVWDIHKAEFIKIIDDGISAEHLAISPDGKFFAIGTLSDKSVYLYSTETWSMIKKLGNHSQVLNDVEFSPDSKMIASCGEDGLVYIWDVNTQKLVRTIEYEKHLSLTRIRFTSDSEYILVTGVTNNLPTFWSVSSGEKYYEINLPNAGGSVSTLSKNDDFLWGTLVMFSLDLTPSLVKNNETTPEIDILPNPGYNEIKILINDHTYNVNLKLKITNIDGTIVKELILENNIYTNEYTVNISDLVSGTYMVIIETSKERYSKKLVINR